MKERKEKFLRLHALNSDWIILFYVYPFLRKEIYLSKKYIFICHSFLATRSELGWDYLRHDTGASIEPSNLLSLSLKKLICPAIQSSTRTILWVLMNRYPHIQDCVSCFG